MKKLVCVIPHSHTFFWSQTCVASLMRNPPRAGGCEVAIIFVDNSPWSPAARGITDTSLLDAKPPDISFEVLPNHKNNKFHASALDCVVEKYEFDYLMALETDVLACRPDWLGWFVDQLRETDYAVGAWHHEQFVNPSCTLYRGSVLRAMDAWCKNHPDPDVLRWGSLFDKTMPLDNNLNLSENPAKVLDDIKSWVAGPFAEKRGWPAGTVLRETPSGQMKSGGWYEPGQQLHHWAVEAGYTYTVCPSLTTQRHDGLPLQTLYGTDMPDPGRQLEAVELFGNCRAAHLWGGTRALDILKHPVTCQFVRGNTPYWLAREARYWKHVVPPDVQAQTLDLIRQYGWHLRGQGADHVEQRDRDAAEYVRGCYAEGNVIW